MCLLSPKHPITNDFNNQNLRLLVVTMHSVHDKKHKCVGPLGPDANLGIQNFANNLKGGKLSPNLQLKTSFTSRRHAIRQQHKRQFSRKHTTINEKDLKCDGGKKNKVESRKREANGGKEASLSDGLIYETERGRSNNGQEQPH